MGLTDHLVDAIPAATRRKGDGIVRRGDVGDLEQPRSDWITATAYGTQPYRVEIGMSEQGDLVGSCSCPAFVNYGPCKHMWAVGVLADETCMEIEGLDDEDLDEGGFEDVGEYLDLADDVVAARFGRDRGGPRDWPGWFFRMSAAGADDVDPFAGHVPEDVRLVYTLDAPTSRERGQVVVRAWRQTRKRDGRWSRPSHCVPGNARTQATARSEDVPLLDALIRQEEARRRGWRTHASHALEERGAHDRLVRLLPAFAATGRFFHAQEAHDLEAAPIAWDEGDPFAFGLHVGRGERDGDAVLDGFYARGEERLGVREPDLIVPGFLVHGSVLARVEAGDAFDVAVMLRRGGPLTAPGSAWSALLRSILRRARGIDLEIDGFEVAEKIRPTPILQIGGPDSGRGMKTRLPCRIVFRYGALRVDATQPDGYLTDEDLTVLVERDWDAEREAVETLLEAGGLPPPTSAPIGEARLLASRFADVVRALLGKGWAVVADGVPYRRPGSFQFSVSSGIDWFDLQGGLEFDGEVAGLPALLEAARRGSHSVRLGDGSVGMLPESWMEGWELAGALGTVEGDGLRFRANQGWALDALLAAQPQVPVDRKFEAYRTKLKHFAGIEPAEAPETLHATLRGYQQEGLAWLQFLQSMGLGGCLADDMGLGKTIQVLSLLLARKAGRKRPRPSLVVAPRSLVHHWRAEAARFAPSLSVLDLTGPGRHERLERVGEHDLAVTTYGTLRRDIVKLKDVRFDHAILDEAQAIKNVRSQTAKAARLLRADHRLALSGTPVENHLGELWSIFEFLNPGMLGRAKAFKDLVGGTNGKDVDEAGRARIARAIRPFVLRRTKDEVLDDLPEKSEQVLLCELGARQAADYRRIKDHVRTTLRKKARKEPEGRMKIHVLEALLRLRQAACHVGLLDADRRGEGSAKLDVLLPRLREVCRSDHKALVFSQFTKLLGILRDRLDAEGITYEYLDGRTRKRQPRIERFQSDPECRAFLISLKAGGLGLNLTAADYVFLLDPWWNPAVERQAVDRAHRIGQRRRVIAYRLIASNTVEEKVLDLQAQKRELAEAVIGGNRSALKDLTRQDLESLFA